MALRSVDSFKAPDDIKVAGGFGYSEAAGASELLNREASLQVGVLRGSGAKPLLPLSDSCRFRRRLGSRARILYLFRGFVAQ